MCFLPQINVRNEIYPKDPCHKHKTLGSYHHVMDPQIHIWKPYPQCDGLGGGVFGRSFGFGEVMRVELSGMGLVPS